MEIDEFLDKELGTVKLSKPGAAEEILQAGKGFDERTGKVAESEIDSLIAQANEFISKGDFESAGKIYAKIKDLRRMLPTEFLKKEEKLNTSLVDLNKRLAEEMDKSISTEFSRKFTEMTQLFQNASAFIKEDKISSKEDLKKAEEVYAHLKSIYFELPEGFVEKKVVVQEQMLKLYKIIITSKNVIFSQDFRSKAEQINSLMRGVADETNRKNMENATALFRKISELYRQLPPGFLNEKTELQKQILEIYQQLILSRQMVFSGEFDKKKEEVESFLQKTYGLLKGDKMQEALEDYNRLTEVYSKLPAGFYGQKADMELKIMELHHIISLKQNKHALEDAKTKMSEINTLLESAKNYIAGGEYDLAKEAYDEIISIYNSFPEGFHEGSVKIQGSLVDLYKELTRHLHEPFVADVSRTEHKKYDTLLKILVDIHLLIKMKEFSKIKNKYITAYKLYHELPLALIEEKTNLYREIYKAYEELFLYNEAEKLSEYAETKNFDKLRSSLSNIANMYNVLSNKYPEDIELFRHVQNKSLIYLNMLKKNEGVGEEQPSAEKGSDVRKRIKDIAEMKKSQYLPKIEAPDTDAGKYLGDKLTG